MFGLSFATVLTLVVTPSMLMVFTRDTPRKEERRGGWFSRLLRRGKVEEPAAAPQDEPAIDYPKAAE